MLLAGLHLKPFITCQGSVTLLHAKRAILLYFEYNVHHLWAITKLQTIVSDLAKLDYVCYFEGDSRMYAAVAHASVYPRKCRVFYADPSDGHTRAFTIPAGKPTLTRITGCWDDSFEFKSWSNVVCAQREHWMHAVLEQLSFRVFL